MGTYDCGPACCWMIMYYYEMNNKIRKWGNRFVMNDDFSYLDFIRSIGNHVEDGLWTVELLKILKDYDFRFLFLFSLFILVVYIVQLIFIQHHIIISFLTSILYKKLFSFYTQASDLLEETDRVQRLFETVCCSSIHICEVIGLYH